MSYSFNEKKYAHALGLVPLEICDIVTSYTLMKQVLEYSPETVSCREGTHAVYADTLMESILLSLKPKVEKITQLDLYPTYSYYRVYKPGDILPIHKDRAACEISVTACMGYKYITDVQGYNWDMHIKDNDDTTVTPKCSVGDAIVYKGCEVQHWRDAFDVSEGSYQIQAFFHYVDKNGSSADYKYDCRPSLGYPISSRKY
jgi:hypothetical protein